MIILSDLSDYTEPRTVAALGFFDGVHIGHQALIARARGIADDEGCPLAVVAFDRHPLAVLRPDKAPKLLIGAARKRELMRALAVDYLIELPFTSEFANLSPRDFVGYLASSIRPAAIVVGRNYTFGKGGAGDSRELAAICGEIGARVESIPAESRGGEPVSSTRIRALIERGDIDGANALLRHGSLLGGREGNNAKAP